MYEGIDIAGEGDAVVVTCVLCEDWEVSYANGDLDLSTLMNIVRGHKLDCTYKG